jgi:hypothetical protein
MKKILAIVLSICLVLSIGAVSILGASDVISLIVDGQVITSDVAPQIVDGRTLVPVRAVSEALGCEVSWDNNTRSVIIVSKEAIEIRNRITLEEYDAIQIGMTYDQVVSIVGGPGEKTYEYDWGADFKKMTGYRISSSYSWDGLDGTYGSATISFHDNIVESKNQFGLE